MDGRLFAKWSTVLLAAAAGGGLIEGTAGHYGNGASAAASAEASWSVPSIDRQAPVRTETATFSLG